MIFPLWKFWTYSPIGFFAAILWNTSEIIGFERPFAPAVFGLILGAKKREVRHDR